QPPRLRHSSSNRGPAARWIAPSTPPPPSSELLAALTIASTASRVISPCRVEIGMTLHPEDAETGRLDRRVKAGPQAERQHLACLARVDDTIVPKPRRGV